MAAERAPRGELQPCEQERGELVPEEFGRTEWQRGTAVLRDH